MAISGFILIIGAVVLLIWLLTGFKRLRHKFFAMFLIILILFTVISFSVVTKNRGVDLKTAPGVLQAGKLYFSWLGSLFGNVKSITGYATDLDWKSSNSTNGG
ncbi:hypothetical protein HYT23_05595 [Candidatus Pacearchaeota archaeon]|nr:hypothetical protein [Candidatus Pacearchaeota archaeon]